MHNKINFSDINNNKLFDEMVVSSFPEILPLKNIFEKNAWHNETTYDHVKNVFLNMNVFLNENKNIKIDKEILHYATIYHDIGKLDTIRVNDDESTSFSNHELVSAEKLPKQKIISSLGNDGFNFLKLLIERHGDIHQMLDDKKGYMGLLENYKNKFQNLFLENIILALCDIKNGHLMNTNREEYDFRIGVLENFIGQNTS